MEEHASHVIQTDGLRTSSPGTKVCKRILYLQTNNRKKGNPMRSAQPGDPSPPRMPTQLPGSKPVAKKRGRPPLVESQARLSGEGLGAKPYAGGEPGVVKKRGRPRSIDKGEVGMKRAKVEGRTGKKVDRPPLAAGSGDFMKLKEREPTVAVVEKVVTSSEFEEVRTQYAWPCTSISMKIYLQTASKYQVAKATQNADVSDVVSEVKKHQGTEGEIR
jgi:hypothetical protein